MMHRDEKSQTCAQCGADVTRSGPIVHCTGRAFSLSVKRPHHGRKAWVCPRCDRHLGCDECKGRYQADILCKACGFYLDGHPAVRLTNDDTALLVELVKHSRPERAVSPQKLAMNLCWPEIQVARAIQSLAGKGIVIGCNSGKYFFDTVAEPPPPTVQQLILPLASEHKGYH